MKVDESYKSGLKTEKEFITYLTNKGWTFIREATEKENKIDHFDQVWKKDNKTYRIEIKKQKRQSRWHSRPCDDSTFVELRGVGYYRNGRWNESTGWLYGKADIFAMEYNGEFLLVDKKKLQKLVADANLNLDEPYIKGSESVPLWTVYCRQSRPLERCIRVTYEDINKCLRD